MHQDFSSLFSAFAWFLPFMFAMSAYAYASMDDDIKHGLDKNQTLVICIFCLLIALGVIGALGLFD